MFIHMSVISVSSRLQTGFFEAVNLQAATLDVAAANFPFAVLTLVSNFYMPH